MIPSFVGRVSRRRNPPDVNPCGAMRFALRLRSGQAYCALRGLIPHFELGLAGMGGLPPNSQKGGLGGICVESTMLVEMEA